MDEASAETKYLRWKKRWEWFYRNRIKIQHSCFINTERFYSKFLNKCPSLIKTSLKTFKMFKKTPRVFIGENAIWVKIKLVRNGTSKKSWSNQK